MQEQADGESRRAGQYHQWIKKQKHREERRRCKEALKNGEQPISTYGKYQGYET